MKKQQQHILQAAVLGLAATGLSTAGATSLSLGSGGTLSSISIAGSTSIYDVFGHAGDSGGDYGPDTPATEITFNPGAGNVFTFSASGLINCCSGTPNEPADGGSGSSNITGANGLSSISGNSINPLVGVFTTDTDPFGSTAPAALNYDATAPTSLAPALDQVFYIGDGKSGDNDASGTPLTFTAPANATRLYLGIIDAYSFGGVTGYYHDNTGSFSVDATLTPAVPEPQTWSLMALGGLVTAWALRRAR